MPSQANPEASMRQILRSLAKLIDVGNTGESADVSIAVGRDRALYYAASLSIAALERRLRPLPWAKAEGRYRKASLLDTVVSCLHPTSSKNAKMLSRP